MSHRITEKPKPIYEAIPGEGTEAGPWPVQYLDNVMLTIKNIASVPSTIITVIPSASDTGLDGDWIPLKNNILVLSPVNLIVFFNLKGIPFSHVKLIFSDVISGGDTFTVRGKGKGFT